MIYLLCAALALACLMLAVALRRARADAAFQRHQVNVAGEMLGRLKTAADIAALQKPAVVYAGPVRALPRRRVSEPAPPCLHCARAVICTVVVRHLRAPAYATREPRREGEPTEAFIVRWGDA